MEKKKKQFQPLSANGHMESMNAISQNDLQSQKKKKKKKKENDERNHSISQQSILEVEESIVKKKKKKRDQQDIEESPRKKTKTNKEEENTALQTSTQNVYAQENKPRTKKIKKENIEIETVEPVIDENWWPPEERTAMLEAMKAQIQVTGRFTRVGYLTHLRKTKWEDVVIAVNSTTQTSSRTVQQCKDQFHRLLNKVGTIKSLNQILDEALNLATDPSALRREVTQARHRFIKDYMTKNKGTKDCNIMAATRIWTNLPPEEKDVWEEAYQNELRQKGLLDVKSKSKKPEGPVNCKYPFELYQETRAAKGEELSSADAKSKYTSLSLKKKIPFIVESLKQQKVYEAEAAKYLEKNPKWKKVKAHGPTNKEIKDYLESLGLPLAPPSNVVGMYYMEEKDKFTENNLNDSAKVKSINDSFKPYQRAREAFSSLPKDQQTQYKLEWKKSWVEYLSEVEKWRPIIEERHPDILEHAVAALAEVKAPKNVSETPTKKAPVRKKPVDPLSHIERRTSSLTNVKFTDEPPLPARTAYELFQQKFKRDAGSNYMPSKAKEFWGRLNEGKKAIYTDRVSLLKQRSKNNFLSFARNLESQQRKLFVGIKRDKLTKYFQEDIFAEEYPGEDYPILIPASKKDSTLQVVRDSDLSEDEHQPSNSSISKKGGIKALAAKMKQETIKEESSGEESADDDEENDDDDDDDNEEEGKEEKDESDSDSSSDSDSDSDSDSEVEASQPTVVSPFSVPKSGENSSRVSNIANSSPFSGKLPSKEESSDSEDDSDDESDSDDDKENYETPVSSRGQSKTNQRSGAVTSTPAVEEEMSSDSESSSDSSSESDDDSDSDSVSKNTSTSAMSNAKGSGSIKKEESSDDSSEEESEESD